MQKKRLSLVVENLKQSGISTKEIDSAIQMLIKESSESEYIIEKSVNEMILSTPIEEVSEMISTVSKRVSDLAKNVDAIDKLAERFWNGESGRLSFMKLKSTKQSTKQLFCIGDEDEILIQMDAMGGDKLSTIYRSKKAITELGNVYDIAFILQRIFKVSPTNLSSIKVSVVNGEIVYQTKKGKTTLLDEIRVTYKE